MSELSVLFSCFCSEDEGLALRISPLHHPSTGQGRQEDNREHAGEKTHMKRRGPPMCLSCVSSSMTFQFWYCFAVAAAVRVCFVFFVKFASVHTYTYTHTHTQILSTRRLALSPHTMHCISPCSLLIALSNSCLSTQT